jgi:hypothetical protein
MMVPFTPCSDARKPDRTASDDDDDDEDNEVEVIERPTTIATTSTANDAKGDSADG